MSEKSKKSISIKKSLLFIISLFVVGVACLIVLSNLRNAVDNAESFPETELSQNFVDETMKSGEIITFTSDEFRDLYNSFAYPNTEFIQEETHIFGNKEVDQHIKKVAEERGYKKRSAPVQDTFIEVEPGVLLQQRAAEDWNKLKESARNSNIQLFLTAGYRSNKNQRQIFLDRLAEIDLREELIASGEFDAKLNEVLTTTAIPGYSRHHTGYTIDIGCGNSPNVEFEFTTCFNWLKANNYLNAKKHGWIPSYPENTKLQGPEPEAWEYVWVGIDSLTN